MRKTLLALAATLIAANSFSFADDKVSVYGKANVTFGQVEKGSTDTLQLNSNASRLGVKGGHGIGEGLEAIFQMEFEVFLDDGNSSQSKGKDTLEQRNSFGGFKGAFGTIIAGKHDTPVKLSTAKIDRFNDLVLGDIKNYMEGEDRPTNILMYASPASNGFHALAAIVLAEDSNEDDGTSFSLNYTNDWITTAVSRNDSLDSQDLTRFVAEFTVENTKIALLLQRVDSVNGPASEDSWFVSGERKLSDGWKLKGQYGTTNYSSNYKDTQTTIGVDKKLSELAKIFAYYSRIEHDMGSSSVDDSTFSVGFEIKFK